MAQTTKRIVIFRGFLILFAVPRMPHNKKDSRHKHPGVFDVVVMSSWPCGWPDYFNAARPSFAGLNIFLLIFDLKIYFLTRAAFLARANAACAADSSRSST